jgi:predicted metal-binding membrane protein
MPQTHDAAHQPETSIGPEPQSPSGGRPPWAALRHRDTLLLFISIGLIVTIAWLYLIRLDRQMAAAVAENQMMAAMGMPMDKPWTATDFFFTFAMWAVMMVGMMGPSVAPMILLFAATQSERGKQRVLLSAGAFALGYVFVWTVFSAGAALVQWALHQTALLSPAMAVLSPRIGGAVLIAAGMYQMTRGRMGA